MSNPFNCNCHLKWLKEWLRNSNLATGNPKCNTPEKLKDKSITSLDDKELVCQISNEECGDPNISSSFNITIKTSDVIPLSQPVYTCPKNCTCLNYIVRCSHSGLKKIPEDININVQELYLDSNEITEIPDHLKKLTNLVKM